MARTRQHQLHTLPENDLIRVQAQRVLSDLERHGDPFKVATYLWAKGAKGKPSSDLDCPLSNYITRLISGVGTVWVSPQWIALYDSPFRNKAVWRVPISLAPWPVVRQFIRRFDFGLYPNLLDRESGQIYTG